MDIVLISPPWPLFNRPSVQVGALKSFLKSREPGLQIRTYHPYLRLASEIGFDEYLKISQSSWAAESVFAALLFPGRKGPEELFKKAAAGRFGRGQAVPDFKKITACAEQTVEAFLERLPDVRLAGLSLCLNQLTAGLYIAKRLKQRLPETAVVVGGASCSGILGKGLLDAFSFIDYAVTGEGELPLLDLWHFLSGKKEEITSRAVYWRGRQGAVRKEQVSDISSLPLPDFDDYFSEISRLGPRASGIVPLLPIEASRGCWWARCNFCNLNLQWKGYRIKSPEKIAREIDFLSQRYMVLDFAFMDNCLPPRQAPVIFELTRRHKRDYSFFAELRTGHSRQDLAVMASGGLKDVQVGIEALSTSLLARLGKGTSAMNNLAVMRHCTELGINLQANLILHFPGSSDEEIRQTMENLDFAWPFASLKTVSFWMGMESPVCRHPARFGIKAKGPHRFYSLLFPHSTADKLEALILEYRGDRKKQRRMWKKVEKKVKEMKRAKAALSDTQGLLTYRDGRQFLIIRQVLPDGTILRHRLTGPSRSLYLACLEPVSLDYLAETAEGLPREKIAAFVDDLHAKRLMFREGERVISLAIRENKYAPIDGKQ